MRFLTDCEVWRHRPTGLTSKNKVTCVYSAVAQTWPVAVGIFFANILLAYLCLKLYDEPVRKWLSAKFLHK